MLPNLDAEALLETGLSARDSKALLERLRALPANLPAPELWSEVSRSILKPGWPFSLHWRLYNAVFADWSPSQGPPPAWSPTDDEVSNTNLHRLQRQIGKSTPEDLYEWSTHDRPAFWQKIIEALGIFFTERPRSIVDYPHGPERPSWLPGARLNIVLSCLSADPNAPAVVYGDESGPPKTMTYAELDRLSNRVSNALTQAGLTPGGRVAIAMPMTVEAVAAYLGVVKAGLAVVSVADSFAAVEIAARLRIADARVVVTQDVVLRAGKTFPMYQKVAEAGAKSVIVVPAGGAGLRLPLRAGDVEWEGFLAKNDRFVARPCAPDDVINILFSSGTTGDPKAIPWTQTTPIKCAMDGYLHHDIKPGDVVCWPTNIGWMMGPWLIFATLINRGTMALFNGSPGTAEFCRFVQDAKVNVLGVVPSLVKAWRQSKATDGCDWSPIKVFSSTGEASNAEDMLFLMSRAGYRPVVEYCGGTEIGGGYITGTLVRPTSPATFSIPAFGLALHVLDDDGKPADTGELFLEPPSIGLSNELLNADHHHVYYEGTPKGPNGELLRRHGDQIERLPRGYFRALGRADDTMNLGGIKVSAAEIERVASTAPGVSETAAIACSPEGGGPSRLVIFAVPKPGAELDAEHLTQSIQRAIAVRLNPLFRVHDVVVIDDLPRTASNKVMRRVLRDQYTEKKPGQ